MLKYLLFISFVILIGVWCYFGNSKIQHDLSPGLIREKSCNCNQSEQKKIASELAAYITNDHPYLWKRYWQKNYLIAKASPYSFMDSLALKNVEWLENAFYMDDRDIYCVSIEEINGAIEELVQTEAKTIHLDLLRRESQSAIRLDLSNDEMQIMNNKLFISALKKLTKDAFLKRVS